MATIESTGIGIITINTIAIDTVSISAVDAIKIRLNAELPSMRE